MSQRNPSRWVFVALVGGAAPPRWGDATGARVGRSLGIMAVADFTRARDRLRRLEGDPDLTATLEATQAALHDVATFSWSALMTVDPDTLLPDRGSGRRIRGRGVRPVLGQRTPCAWLQQVHRPRPQHHLGRDPLRGHRRRPRTGADLHQPVRAARGRGRAPGGVRGRLAMLGRREPAASPRRRPIHRRRVPQRRSPRTDHRQGAPGRRRRPRHRSERRCRDAGRRPRQPGRRTSPSRPASCSTSSGPSASTRTGFPPSFATSSPGLGPVARRRTSPPDCTGPRGAGDG